MNLLPSKGQKIVIIHLNGYVTEMQFFDISRINFRNRFRGTLRSSDTASVKLSLVILSQPGIAQVQLQTPPMPACKYVAEISSAIMLVTKRSAGVALEVNLRILLHLGCK